MPLSRLDMRRIIKLGYSLKDFAVKTTDGWQLKNSSGRCVFLSGEGCEIYRYRPEGCRLYPLVYDESSETVRFDDVCPYTEEFEATEEDIQRLINLLIQLEKERKEDNIS